jgi:sterol desaturase/sphingolipid hydroxylase (fatty acid hydroxylase superfamily)
LSNSFRPWFDRKYFLDKMTLRALAAAYFSYYAVIVYLVLAAVTLGLALIWRDGAAALVLAALSVVVIYPLAWYLLHRFILHGRFLFKIPATARLWKRAHFDHHQDPNDLKVLFGALYTTLPTVALVAGGAGWLIGGPAGAAAGIATGLIVTCIYEFCHCIQHLPFIPRSAWLRRMKKLHVAHHFHNEQGNFGITSFVCDRLFGTFYPHPKAVERSPTVFNLGYDERAAERYPWVARLSESGDSALT